jgi:hypothetical protein
MASVVAASPRWWWLLLLLLLLLEWRADGTRCRAPANARSKLTVAPGLDDAGGTLRR